jgi:UDP:flavonoid glycosyltransferase YjiC (YdhE family)
LAGQFLPEQEAALRTLLPAETVIEQAIAFSTTLPNVAAAIHHGGAGVTHALVTHAVPQIIVPHAADQFHQAQGVARSGVGYYMAAPDVTVDKLTAALAQLLPDLSPVRAQAVALRAEFAALGGTAAAADQLEQQKADP